MTRSNRLRCPPWRTATQVSRYRPPPSIREAMATSSGNICPPDGNLRLWEYGTVRKTASLRPSVRRGSGWNRICVVTRRRAGTAPAPRAMGARSQVRRLPYIDTDQPTKVD